MPHVIVSMAGLPPSDSEVGGSVSGSADDVAGSASSDTGDADAARARRRGGAGARRRGDAVYLLVESPTPLFKGLRLPGFPVEDAERPHGSKLVGVVLGSWTCSAEADGDEEQHMASMAMKLSRAVTLHGYIFYNARRVLRLCELLVVPRDALPFDVLRRARDCLVEGRDVVGQRPFGESVDPWLLEVGQHLQVAQVCNELATHVMSEAWSCFHCAPLTARVDRARILGLQPSSHTLKRLRREFQARPVPPTLQRTQVRRSNFGGAPAEVIIAWMFATRTSVDMQKGTAAKSDWVRVFSRGPDERAKLVAQSTHVHHDTLRQARVRLDCVGMLLWQLLLQTFNFAELFVYVHTDGAPQWRGHEMFASSIDVICGEFCRRLPMPLISLGRCCLGAAGMMDWI